MVTLHASAKQYKQDPEGNKEDADLSQSAECQEAGQHECVGMYETDLSSFPE